MRNVRHILFMLIFAALTAGAQEPTTLTLSQAVAFALEHNPALRQAAETAAAGRAAADRAKAPRQVQVGAGSRYVHLGEVNSITIGPLGSVELGEPDTLTTALTAQQVIYSGGRLEGLQRQAESGARAQEVSRARVRQAVVFETERAFLALLNALRQTEVARQAQRTAEQQLAVARARFDAGTAAKYDVLHAEVLVEETRQGVIAAEAAVEAAQAGLARALGTEGGALVASGDGITEPAAPPALDEMLATAQKQRPELQALEWQIRGAEAAIATARGESKPTVALQAGYQLVSPASIMTNSGWSAGASVSLPVLDGGSAKAGVRQAEAQRDGLLAARDAQRNAVAMEVRQAYAHLTAAANAVQVARKRLEQAEALFQIATVRQEAGVGTAVEIADAQTTLTRARQGVNQALTEWNLAAAELRLATGQEVLTGTDGEN
ncbi:MAG: TolC family protein [Armatimonadota bacterium]